MQRQEYDEDTIAAAESLLASKKNVIKERIVELKVKAKRGRPKGRKTTTHPDIKRPSRPLSAYNLFFKDERRRIVESFNETNKLNFSDLAKEIGSRWKNIDSETKKPYEEKAAEEMNKYKEGMKVFNDKIRELTKAETEQNKNNKHDDDDDKRNIKKAKVTKSINEHDTASDDSQVTSELTPSEPKAPIFSPRSLLPLRKRRFEVVVEDHDVKSFSPTKVKKMPVAAAVVPSSLHQHADDGSKTSDVGNVTSLSFQPTQPQQQGGVAALLEQQMRLQQMMMGGTSTTAPDTLRSLSSLPPPTAAAAGADPYQVVSRLAASLSSPQAQQQPQSNFKDIVSNSARELEAAKRLVEERQFQHDMALRAAAVTAQQEQQQQMKHQQQQVAALMLQRVQQQQQREQQEQSEQRRRLQQQLLISSLLSKHNGGLL